MALQYNGVAVDKVLYNGQEVKELQYNGVTVWKGVQVTQIVSAKNIFDSKRGFGGGLSGGSIGKVLGRTVQEFTVTNFNHDIRLFFGYNIKPANTIRVTAPDVVFSPSFELDWNGRWFAGKDSGASQLFSALQPGKAVNLIFEAVG